MLPPPYRVGRNNEGTRFTIVLELPLGMFEALPATIEFDGGNFFKKKEFHVTLVHALASLEESLTSRFKAFVEAHPIALLGFDTDIRVAEKDVNRSIIVRCTVACLDELFIELRAAGFDLPLQPAHVTLYSIVDNVGIAIDSIAEMESLPQVKIPALEAALSEIEF